jgi:hypothetical protein
MNTKTYDYLSIPLEIRNVFYEHIDGAIDAAPDIYESTINDPDSMLAHLVLLCWLFANDQLIIHTVKTEDGRRSIYAEVEPTFIATNNFCYDWYEGLNGLQVGINLWDSLIYFQLDELAYLLKHS